MKINARAEDKITLGEGLTETRDFQIKAGSAAFQILSSGLYSDKETAIIRELTCNAIDAVKEREKLLSGTKEAAEKLAKRGIDKAFLETDPKTTYTLTYPSQLLSEFIVKDYGIGLSEEDLFTLYSTYFSSSKADDNENIGGFGLGSKSPFSYVESFTVESRFNGTLYVYTAMVGEGGVPKLVKLGQAKTDEKNGLTIKVPVKPDGFRVFQEKSKYLFSRFKEKPTIIGNPFEIPEASYIILTDTYGIRTKDFDKHLGDDENVVIMGGIPYPLDLEKLNADGDDEKALVKYFDCKLIDFFVNIGDLELTPSRESLSYDAAGIKRIKEFLKDTYKDIKKQYIEKLEEAKTIIDIETVLKSVSDIEGQWSVLYEEIQSKAAEKLKKFEIKSPVNNLVFHPIFNSKSFRVSIPSLFSATKKDIEDANLVIKNNRVENLENWSTALDIKLSGVVTYSDGSIAVNTTRNWIVSTSFIPSYNNGHKSIFVFKSDVRNHKRSLEFMLKKLGDEDFTKKLQKNKKNTIRQSWIDSSENWKFIRDEETWKILMSLKDTLLVSNSFVDLDTITIPKNATPPRPSSKACLQRHKGYSKNSDVVCKESIEEFLDVNDKSIFVYRIENRGFVCKELDKKLTILRNFGDFFDNYVFYGVPKSRWHEIEGKGYQILEKVEDLDKIVSAFAKKNMKRIRSAVIYYYLNNKTYLASHSINTQHELEKIENVDSRVANTKLYKKVKYTKKLTEYYEYSGDVRASLWSDYDTFFGEGSREKMLSRYEKVLFSGEDELQEKMPFFWLMVFKSSGQFPERVSKEMAQYIIDNDY